jgi:acylphosphatase
MTKECKRYLVSGKVQGVWYRANTKSIADNLGVTGWVKNAEDGQVELVACGDRAQLEALEAWLKKGPPQAEVDNVINEDLPWEDFVHFVIKY